MAAVWIMRRGANGVRGCGQALGSFARLMGSDTSVEAGAASSLSSTCGDPFFAPTSLARFNDPRLVQPKWKASFDITLAGTNGRWTGSSLTGSFAAPLAGREAGNSVPARGAPGSAVGSAIGNAAETIKNTAGYTNEDLLCDSVRRKRKKKMNKHKHAKRLKLNKHKR